MSAKRARKSKNFHNNVVQLNNYLPEKKKTVKIYPRNRAQEEYLLTLADTRKDVVFGIGPAGTGKTIIAVLTAVKLFKEGSVDKIVVTRPAVSVDEDLGFLPGTLEQKMAPWTRPVFDVLREYFTATEIENMINDKFGLGTMTTADQAPEPDSSILRRLFERFTKENMAQGGRVGFANGSPNPMEEMATLRQAIAAVRSP